VQVYQQGRHGHSEMGLDDDPISPVSREETVTNKKPSSTINTAPTGRGA